MRLRPWDCPNTRLDRWATERGELTRRWVLMVWESGRSLPHDRDVPPDFSRNRTSCQRRPAGAVGWQTSRPVRRLLLTLVGHTIFCLFETSAPSQTAADGSRQQVNPSNSSSAAEPPGTDAPRTDALIGKFEILATYIYAKALRAGLPEPEAKQRGIVAAVMGARARGVSPGRFASPSRFQDIEARRGNQEADAHRRDVRPAGRLQIATFLRLGVSANDEATGRRPPDL